MQNSLYAYSYLDSELLITVYSFLFYSIII